MAEVLELWRLHRAPSLSALLLRLEDPAPPLEEDDVVAQANLAQRLTDQLVASTDETRAPILAAFKVLAVNALPSKLWPVLKTWPKVPADFRVAALALDFLTRRGAVREVTHKLAAALLDLLAAHGDRSVVPTLTAWMDAGGMHTDWQRHVRDTLRRLEAYPASEPDAATLARLSASAKKLPAAASTADGDALFTTVLEHPDDDGARLAYADWLTEQGDERGELIVLQINRARGRVPAEARKREKLLLTRNRTALLGPLAQSVRLSSLEFARGFPVTADLYSNTPAARELGLFEELSFRGHRIPDVPLPALRRAFGVRLSEAPTLVARAPRLERLELFLGRDPPPALFSQPTAALRHLEVQCAPTERDVVFALTCRPYCAALETLTFDERAFSSAFLGASTLGRLPTSVREVTLRRGRSLRACYQVRDGAFEVLRLELLELGDPGVLARDALRAFGAPLALLELKARKPIDLAAVEAQLGPARGAVGELRLA